MITVFVDMDHTIADFEKRFTMKRRESPHQMYPQAEVDFFRKLEPIRGSMGAIRTMKNWGIDVWICTRPSAKNPLCYMEKRLWVEDHLGYEMCEKLMIVPNKGMVVPDDPNSASYLVDDTLWPNFKGTQLLYGSSDFPDWMSVLNYLKPRLELM